MLTLLAAAPLAVQATLYKWVDERGVVNYGDTPPAGAKKTTELDESKSSLSVVPGMSKEELAQLRERDSQARVAQLEREVEALRARAPMPPPPAYDSQLAYGPTYVAPLLLARRFPLHDARFPVHGKPVQKTPPFRGMRLEPR